MKNFDPPLVVTHTLEYSSNNFKTYMNLFLKFPKKIIRWWSINYQHEIENVYFFLTQKTGLKTEDQDLHRVHIPQTNE